MFKKLSSLIVFLYSFVIHASTSMLSPQLSCVSVLPNGDVTITWSTPADPGGVFNSYHIYRSNALGGPYTVLDSIFTYSQNSYTHLGANANLASVYYYIESRYTNGVQVYAPALDTIKSIHLNVINPGNGTAVLSWNPIAKQAISTSIGIYNILREHPLGTWTLAGTTTKLNYIDTIYICNDTINYRVEIADNTGCKSVSSVAGGKFQNTIVPSIPIIDTLSVDDTNNALMNWSVNPAPDVKGYVIYRLSGGAKIPIDTVFGINNTKYNYLLSIADLMSEGYTVAAFDTCGNLSPFGPIFNTIYLTSKPDICNRSVILNWTAYPIIGKGLAGYNIYQSATDTLGPYTLIGNVPAGTLTFTAPGLSPSITYYYKIVAVDGSGVKTVSSNRMKFYSSIPIPPTFSYLRKVSVTAPDRIDLRCHVDIAASTRKYKIMRSLDGVTNFTLVGTVPKGAVTPILFSDYKVLTDKYSYYYKVINVDSCGYDGLETNLGRTILLTAISNSDNMTNTLTWNDYELWSGGVLSYNIYRGIDGALDPVPIANVPFTGGVNTYVDDISGLLQGQGVFNYYVEALEGVGNIYGFSETSLSNIAESYQEPLIHIPNAFHPGEKYNAIFIPVTTFVDFTEYKFDIFDRWGQQLFTTNTITQGWDGIFGGKLCPLGVYVYYLRFKTSKAEYVERKGTVTLVQ